MIDILPIIRRGDGVHTCVHCGRELRPEDFHNRNHIRPKYCTAICRKREERRRWKLRVRNRKGGEA